MDKNRSELFGQVVYEDSLTYESLLEIESQLTDALDELLQRAGGEHLDFTPLGDALMFECAFEEHRLYVYRKIAMEISAMLPDGVRCKMLCLDKRLSGMHLFWLRAGTWQEQALPMTNDAPSDGAALEKANDKPAGGSQRQKRGPIPPDAN